MAITSFLLACEATPQSTGADPPEAPDGLLIAAVTSVSDGDSLEVLDDSGPIEVRLIGLNAPERGECFYREAVDHLIDMLEGRDIGLDVIGEDQFGRSLANVWADGTLVNHVLVRRGYAIAQDPDDRNRFGRAQLEAEQAAFDQGLGIWSETACGAEDRVPHVVFDLDSSMVDPPGDDSQVLEDEYVTIVNQGQEPVDLGGWTLRDESSRNRLSIVAGTTLEPGETLAIDSGCASAVSWCSETPIWNNGGDMALLLDESGTVVARARY